MFSGNWRFITMFPAAPYFSIPWARCINSMHKNVTNLFKIPFNSSPKNGTCSAHIFHDFIVLMIFAGNTYLTSTQYTHFFLPSLTFSILGTNIFLGTLFPKDSQSVWQHLFTPSQYIKFFCLLCLFKLYISPTCSCRLDLFHASQSLSQEDINNGSCCCIMCVT
jgi:hypothetical protein